MKFRSVCKNSYIDRSGKKLLIVGNEYNIVYNTEGKYYDIFDDMYEPIFAYNKIRGYYSAFSEEIFNKYFHTIEDVREIKINKILKYIFDIR